MRHSGKWSGLARIVALAGSLAAAAWAQTTERVSLSSSGEEGDGQSGFYDPAISADGVVVAFSSFASNLVPGDTNGAWDVFVHDRASGTTQRVSVTPAGGQASGDSGGEWGLQGDGVDLSADGRWVAFFSTAPDIVPVDGNGTSDVFVRDLLVGKTWRVSVTSAGGEAHGASTWPSLSHDGRFVAFSSVAPDLVAVDGNGASDVFVHDLLTGATERVSVSSAGTEGTGASIYPVISPDASVVGFSSYAPDLVPLDGNGLLDTFVHVLATGQTVRVSVDAAGFEKQGQSAMGDFSFDGRYAGFSCSAPLVPEDTNGAWDDYVRDLIAGTIERVSVGTGGLQSNDSSYGLSLSGDGRYVAFSGYASNLVAGDVNHDQDVFLHDRLTGATTLASTSSTGAHGNAESCYPELSLDGRVVAFTSHSNNLVPGDGNFVQDVFVHGRFLLGLVGTPSAGQVVRFSASQASPPQAGKLAIVLLSCSGVAGIGLAGGAVVWLTDDACTTLGLANLSEFTGVVDLAGSAQTPPLTVPAVPPGLTVFAAAVTYDAVVGEVGSVADPIVIVTE
jgi:Tol biopolymer transport system component